MRNQRINIPVTVIGVTQDGKKIYEGNLIPVAPNRRTRRNYLQQGNTNNAALTRGRRQHIELRPKAEILNKDKEGTGEYRKPTLINHYKEWLRRAK